MSKSLELRAMEYAIACHESVNHRYDKFLPYVVHLAKVREVMSRYSDLIPPVDRDIVAGACWAHDIIEDTRQTYNDVYHRCGEPIANIVFALTNEKGKNRAERANDKYYAGIRATEYATFVKLCDRIANIEYSKMSGESGYRMFQLYKKEQPDFQRHLFDAKYIDMFSHMANLF